MSALEDYILSYRNADGDLVITLQGYYEDYIKPLQKKFEPWSFYSNKLVLCWFPDHEDKNPSMGYMPDHKHKGQSLYHCFGCGRTGNIVRLHQQIEELYHGNKLSVKDACLNLANKYGVPVDDFAEVDEEDYEGRYKKKLKRIDVLQRHYSKADYISVIRANRSSDLSSLDKLNSENVKMIATEKKLYDY